MTEVAGQTKRLDPDPFTIFLGALGAMGSVASIAAVMDTRKERGRIYRRSRGRFFRSIRALRDTCSEIEVALEELGEYVHLFSEDTSSRPAGFGSNLLELDRFEFDRYYSVVRRISYAYRISSQQAYDVLEAAGDGELPVSIKSLSEMREAQEMMNSLLVSKEPLIEKTSQAQDICHKMTMVLDSLDRTIL